ncbi:MAG: hypothetical protein M1820_000827 [Bogoriella megaspora]|nr:MAG: hypothetical protein M1820_000827 [Bogoriella megaspora]
MLHEVLLALSGHPSPLFDAVKQQDRSSPAQELFPALSSSERELLIPLSQVADLHIQVRNNTKAISASHSSTACRAVSTAIDTRWLARFQQHVLDVETRILKKDASIVGAYDIVPLASIVGEFDSWIRRLQWLANLALFMDPESSSRARSTSGPVGCSSAELLDRLRDSLQTGYPDIEEVANDLIKVAEMAWLRQLSTWILYGRLPQDGDDDFFIHEARSDDISSVDFHIIKNLTPRFVASQTGTSVLFIGKSLNQIRNYYQDQKGGSGIAVGTADLRLLPEHVNLMSEVSSPLSTTQLSRVVSSIRSSLSRNMLQELLPLPRIIQYLSVLHQFLLLGRGEFAATLIAEADSRGPITGPEFYSTRKPTRTLSAIVPKDGEVTAVLARTFSSLSATDYEDDLDEEMSLAQDHLRLTVFAETAEEKDTDADFRDVLFSVPVTLGMRIPAPFDLFLAKPELEIYSDINSYLIALRRAHIRLANLWKQTSLRRDHPSPHGPPRSNTPYGQNSMKTRRERTRSRSLALRKIWATCGAALFLMSEITNYFEGEVVRDSWQHFRSWVAQGIQSRPSSSSSIKSTNSKTTSALNLSLHDPETISAAHRTFLDTLVSSLLLTDTRLTSKLRTLLTYIDALIAHFQRLQTIQSALDLEADEGVFDALTDYSREEREVSLEIDRSRKRLDEGMKDVVARFRELDAQRVGKGAVWGDGGARPKVTLGERERGNETDAYRGWRGGGIDRLLMKLDFGRGMIEDDDDSDG